MKKFAAILLGLTLISTSTGCFCGWPYGHGYYQGGNQWGGPGTTYGTPPGQFQGQPTLTPPQTVVPQSGFYQPYDSFQTAMPSVYGSPMTAFGPAMYQPVPYRTAMGPLESLPTY